MNRRLAVLTATTVLVGLAPTAAAADDADHRSGGSPGAPGIGDPYFPLDGNGGYDVGHYDLDVAYDPHTDVLTGLATITATATQHLSSFNLDLEGMTVHSITVDGKAAGWHREGGELTVVPERSLKHGKDFTVVVAYDGVPQTITDAFGVSGFMHTDDGAVVAGQPDAAATWFPANDHPLDDASVSVAVTVPEGLAGISNGVLKGTWTEHGRTTWVWKAREPMATYLVTLAVGDFDVREYAADGIRYWDAVDPDLYKEPGPEGASIGETVDASFARQPEINGFLAEYFGPYPFRASGGIVDHHPELAFALETQTRPVYAQDFFTDPVLADVVVVHELAHQWTGDLVRLAAWQHIWLNEGMATYAEWLWLEREGLSTVEEEFRSLYDATDLPPGFWDVIIGDPGPATEELFDAAVYYRGAMTLHSLRLVVGDEAFFDILRTWVATYAGQAVTTDDFVAHAEAVSGRELDDLFRTWLFTAGRPALG
ncbi:M1 family metallopeptidase [Blastococcus saxobsidens]|uniref:Aminopeptidase N n=1 Tax=Blastococcus saxobsidens TaxID=138336 RepID=A0A6L9W6J7_9ACTN|nr:M1 family metallopeptidase [Blastococcus saxobsidens]NEK87723.1 M1 family metallopeptidase [Blastococcus saxobsidens]